MLNRGRFGAPAAVLRQLRRQTKQHCCAAMRYSRQVELRARLPREFLEPIANRSKGPQYLLRL
ncbi:hypothetical protein D3C80_2145590 [compost metagenome]